MDFTSSENVNYLHHKGAFIVSFPDGCCVVILGESRRVIILVEQVDPHGGVAVERRRAFSLSHDDQPKTRRILKI